MSGYRTNLMNGVAAAVAMSSLAPATAESAVTAQYDLPPQDLATSLRFVARTSQTQVLFAADLVAGKSAPALRGRFGARDAIEALVAGSGLAVTNAGAVIVIRRAAGAGDPTSDGHPGASESITVTGTRIRGQAVASPVLTRTQEQLQNEGFSSVADAVRALPQSFNGGQNPGVAVGAGGSPDNENLGSGSTINLRGIGQDATLTLLNGHRVAYDIATQGVDVSTIPLAALDRLEVVTDGASALYGSDAVAGVANIILKNDYEGVTTSGRWGAATDGGDFQQEYNLVTGTRWATGGVMLTYDFERDSPVRARDRSYARALYPDDTLLPYQRRHGTILMAHQDLAPNLTFSLEGLFNKRWSNQHFSATPTADYRAYGISDTSADTAFSITPSLKWRVGRDWELSATGVYAQDRAHYTSTLWLNDQPLQPNVGCYCNNFKSIEVGGEGPLFRLPAGGVRLALGGGYRDNGFDAYRTVGSPLNANVSQGTDFAYGELSIPVVSPDLGVPLVRKLQLDGAVRYERYPGIAQVTTPKLGIVYAPTSWVDVKGSWGKSFKAPTLYQLHQTQQSLIYPISTLGGTGFPAGATAIELSGGNPDLKPERATTWTTTLAFHPLPRFEAELSYYHIRYDNRVIEPIPTLSSTFSNPAYAALVTLDPSDAAKQAAVDPSRFDVQNETSGPVNLGQVAAIIDNRNHNIARQTIQGVDASLHYVMTTAQVGTFTFDGAATYLNSRQLFAPGEAPVDLAGIIFNPPHVRGRGGVSWTQHSLTLSGYANYIGSVEDNRFGTRARVGSLTSLDLTGRYQAQSGLLRNMDIILTAQNVLNAKPALIRTTATYDPPYDSTNYSPVGRFISLTVARKW